MDKYFEIIEKLSELPLFKYFDITTNTDTETEFKRDIPIKNMDINHILNIEDKKSQINAKLTHNIDGILEPSFYTLLLFRVP